MWLVYADESGDRGAAGSATYVVAGIVVDAKQWPDVFDRLVAYRRWLRDQFNLPVRAEIKASHLISNGGPLRELKLGDSVRHRIYVAFMRLQAKLGLRTYAIVIRKKEYALRGVATDPRHVAWEYFIQRIERLTSASQEPALILHDEGEALLVRTLARRARRIGTAGSAFGTGSLKRPVRLLIEDPVPRHSDQSLFVQLADLNAYAAFRATVPPPPLAGRVHIVPQGMWDELGSARMHEVNKVRGGPAPGIVAWPEERKAPV